MQRLIAPQSLALIGAGAWTDAVAAGASAIGFSGALWRVHPTRPSTPAARYFRSVGDLPGPPDAAFIAVPAPEVASVAAGLATLGAGGFVCFSAGFSETGTEVGVRLTRDLDSAAHDLPFFGPNCYGFVNFFDRAALLAGPAGRPAHRARRRAHLPERHHRAHADVQRPVAARRPALHRGQSDAARGGGSDRDSCATIRASPPSDCTSKGSAHGAVRARRRSSPGRRQAHCTDQGRTHRGRGHGRAHATPAPLPAATRCSMPSAARRASPACDTLGALCETLKLLHAGGPLPGNGC